MRDVLTDAGVDADAVLAEIATGAPLETVRKEHEAAVASDEVWGVPTFIAGDKAAFVRLMSTADGDADGRPAHRRAHRRPAHRLARAQRVQAHQPQPLTRPRVGP